MARYYMDVPVENGKVEEKKSISQIVVLLTDDGLPSQVAHSGVPMTAVPMILRMAASSIERQLLGGQG